MDRRTSLKLLALGPLPLAAGCTWTSDEVEEAHRQADRYDDVKGSGDYFVVTPTAAC